MPRMLREAHNDKEHPCEEAVDSREARSVVPRARSADKEPRVTTAEAAREPCRQTRRYLTES